ncbi:hypothetical protein M970_100400 [Encephalitozoon cuniculi EcunIII-L]|nr:hypothetical protein M970_100400 [Encephalitozoon cuniculi EcunIII-L]UYI26508.1 hypothetical protein J0A71_02g03370 [Encephalitozoon cuniculi]
MLELPSNSRKGFLYLMDGEGLGAFKDHVGLDSLYMEDHGRVRIVTVNVLEDKLLWSDGEGARETLPDGFRCLHGNEILHRSMNRLPQEGWEELIDCWSCHNCEFKTMLGLTPRPREGGLLLSDFFLLINDADLPGCCRRNDSSIRKLFYNEVLPNGCTHEDLAYSYLNAYFRDKNVLLLEVNQARYEIRHFYRAVLITVENRALSRKEAMKVGIKNTDKITESSESINEFYSKLIYDLVMSGTIDITALGYRISFVTER